MIVGVLDSLVVGMTKYPIGDGWRHPARFREGLLG
jgi:hypothetical protein